MFSSSNFARSSFKDGTISSSPLSVRAAQWSGYCFVRLGNHGYQAAAALVMLLELLENLFGAPKTLDQLEIVRQRFPAHREFLLPHCIHHLPSVLRYNGLARLHSNTGPPALR